MHGCARGPPPEGRWGGRSNPPLLRGWGNISVGGVFCIRSTVRKCNIFVKVVIAVEGI